MSNLDHGLNNGRGKHTLSNVAVAAHPALYRAYRALELALHSGSDSDLVMTLNIYINTANQQGFLVETATILRNSLSIRIIAEEKRLSKQANATPSPCQTQPDPATSETTARCGQ